MMEPVAHWPSTMCLTTLWVSGDMGWLADVAGGLQEEEEAARAPEARSWSVLCSRSAGAVRTASAVAEGVGHSTPDVCFGCALPAVAPYARAVREATWEAHSASDLRRR